MAGVESKSAQAMAALARALLHERPGARLGPLDGLAADAQVGVGTMNRAFNLLADQGAIVASRVQRHGTTLERLDYAALWRHAGRGPLRGTMPLLLSASMQGLATAVMGALGAVGLETALVYREGASSRVRDLRAGGADYTLLSAHALEDVDEVAPVHRFGCGSYYGATGIFRLRRAGDDRVARVGVDESSPDHRTLVHDAFAGAEPVAVPIRQMPSLIADGTLDATVWYGGTAIPVELIDRLSISAVESADADRIAASPAVLVVAPGSEAAELLRGLGPSLDAELRRAVATLLEATTP